VLATQIERGFFCIAPHPCDRRLIARAISSGRRTDVEFAVALTELRSQQNFLSQAPLVVMTEANPVRQGDHLAGAAITCVIWYATGLHSDNPDMKSDFYSVFYRIYTQDMPVYRQKIISILKRRGFRDFTLYGGTGYYKGGAEYSLMVEIAVRSQRDTKIRAVCEEIREENNQESVIYVRFPVEGEFVTGGESAPCWADGADICEVGNPWLLPEPPNRPYRGKLFICGDGDWQKLLPEGAEKVKGRMLVRYTDTQY
jgi:hypothetical protein